jgi:hypothetical protein
VTRSTSTSITSATSSAASRPPSSLTVRRASWSLPAALSRQAAVVDGDQLLVAGGLTTGDRTVATVFRIDPATGRSTSLPALPVPVHDCAGASVAGRPLVLGGGNSAEQAAVQAIGTSPAVVGALPSARADLAATTDSAGTTYVVGGYDGHQAFADVLATTDGRHFRMVGRLPAAVRYPAVAVLGSTLWAFGGEVGGADSDLIQALDLRSGAASVAGHLPGALGHANAFVLHGVVWVVGGRVGGAPSDQIERFDPSARTVSRAGTLPVAVRDAAVAVVGDTAYLLGGQSPDPTTNVVMLR